MNIEKIIDAATQPNVAVPVTTTGALAAKFLDAVPTITMIGWALYVVLVVSHKAWNMYAQWRDDPRALGKGWFK